MNSVNPTIKPPESVAADNDLFARAEQLLPLISSHAEQNDQQRDVAQEVVEAINNAELFKLFQPEQWGGHQTDPRLLYKIQNLFAEQCASTAWIYGVLSVQAFILSLMDQQAQADVWGDTPNALMSSSFMPVGKVTPTEGGYRLSGQWAFSSGSSHASWAILGGMVPPAAEGQPPSMQLFLVPRADYEILDTWHTFGLRGTGSNDIVVKDAFVPKHRTFQPTPGMVPSVTETELAPLYRLPWLYVFTSTVSNLGIGIAQSALNAFLDIERVRVSSLTGKPGKEDPAVHSAAAKMSAEIQATKTMYHHHIEQMMQHIEQGQAMPMDQGLMQRTQLTSALRKLSVIVDEMQLLLGGRGIRIDSPLTRIWLDMCAARAHPGNDPGMIAPSYGKMLLDS